MPLLKVALFGVLDVTEMTCNNSNSLNGLPSCLGFGRFQKAVSFNPLCWPVYADTLSMHRVLIVTSWHQQSQKAVDQANACVPLTTLSGGYLSLPINVSFSCLCKRGQVDGHPQSICWCTLLSSHLEGSVWTPRGLQACCTSVFGT